jgi:hypothetical protein
VQPVLLLPMTVSMHKVGSVKVNEDSNELVRRSECIGGYCDTWMVCPAVGFFVRLQYCILEVVENSVVTCANNNNT